jgi:luciferase family oxidoreductase group 1
MPAVASSAPAVLIVHLANATTTLRIGASGVMLPNHSPLDIAEQFATLEALHPGRIHLGLGRTPGTDHVTAGALRRSDDLHASHLPDDVLELIDYCNDTRGRCLDISPEPSIGGVRTTNGQLPSAAKYLPRMINGKVGEQ